jgi:hypothetical protein
VALAQQVIVKGLETVARAGVMVAFLSKDHLAGRAVIETYNDRGVRDDNGIAALLGRNL